MIFSPIGGIDIEQVAEEQPDKVGRRHFSTIQPFSDFMAKEVIASDGRDRPRSSRASRRSSRGWRGSSPSTT